ncbi:MAG: DNA topoisomerase VI subunit B [Candidatus Marsarchaeota archaeon]|nr:DNA topoisomerase VI subunit B [Candidatus Marsarchaeota archaeon]MCL5105977.1 DNA topoisomerase VI subunit B [Candidatus Marsarchaeota archaeon]
MSDSKADEIFREFKQHSISEFFKKNKQMLGYSGVTRSLVTAVHEYVTNSLDACEEAGILPNIKVKIEKQDDTKFKVIVQDNGPGIPKTYIGKALAVILAGTKFHRFVQQRGQQGIGAAGCTLFSQVTTGKPIFVMSNTGKSAYSCNISIDAKDNKPIIANVEDIKDFDAQAHGLYIEANFAEVKYVMGEHSIYEYLRRTALSNPHLEIKFIDPGNEEFVFLRAINEIPEKPKTVKPHPLGLSVNDLLEYAAYSKANRVSVFLADAFSRVTRDKLKEIEDVNLDKDPKKLTWDEAEKLIEDFKKIKWMLPDTSSIIPIGKDQIKIAIENIINPEYMNVIERKPVVFKGGIPFIVEAAIAFGGNSGTRHEDESNGNILRFANRVPLLFDSGSCAITIAAKTIDWKRYGLDMDTQPISVFVNVSSVHIPYEGVGKESIAKHEEIIEEIRLALMEAARGIQKYIKGKQQINYEANKYKTIMRYSKQLAGDLSSITGRDFNKISLDIIKLVEKHYKNILKKDEGDEKEETMHAGDMGSAGENEP